MNYENPYLRLEPDLWYQNTWILTYKTDQQIISDTEKEKLSREIEDWISPGDCLISYTDLPIHLGPWEETGMYRGPDKLIYKRTDYERPRN